MENEKRMVNIVLLFQEYVATYTKQRHYKKYSNETFIDDMLYGIGIAINKKDYRFANGYKKWKQELITHLTN